MERVDVVVVGQGVCALAAVTRAAREGVRAILVDRGPRLADSPALLTLSADDLGVLELSADAHERPLSTVDGQAIHVVVGASLGAHLEKRARAAGAELRPAVDRATSLRLDADGWRVGIAGSEPIRAPILVLAEGARAPGLVDLGIAAAQRMSPDGADVATWATATWMLPPSELAKHTSLEVQTGPGPLGRLELVPGHDRVTVRLGPVWSSGGSWPSPQHPRVLGMIARAARALDLPLRPTAVELDETRLDALPFPPTFDGGMVVGLGAGHGPRSATSRSAALARLGDAAGRAAAEAILLGTPTARALGEALGEGYRTLCEAALEELGPRGRRLERVFAGLAG